MMLDRLSFHAPVMLLSQRCAYARVMSRGSDEAKYQVDGGFSGAVAQFGRALDWQSRGQGFKSPQLHPKRRHSSP